MYRTARMRVLLGATSAAALLVFGSAAIAQTGGGTTTQVAPTATAGSNEIEQVTVTARRHEENAQTVPITISAFSGEQLRESSVQDTRSIMYQTPGLLLTGQTSTDNTQYIIRGQAPTGQQGHGVPGVLSYFADVPLPFNAQSQPQYDLSNIQVLKGPQGTLFGENTVGGALLVNPVAPSYDGFNGYAEAEGGSFSLREGEAAVNVPVIDDQLAIRLSIHGEQDDGYIKNISTTPGAKNGQEVDDYGVRFQVRWDPTSWLKNTLMFDDYESNTGNAGIVAVFGDNHQPIPPTLFFLQVNPAPPPLIFAPVGSIGTGSFGKEDTGPVAPSELIIQTGVTDRLDADLGIVQLTNIFGYRADRYDSFSNLTGENIVPFNALQRTNAQQFSEELQFRGTLFDNRVSWLLGGFYLKDNPLTGNVGVNEIFSPAPENASYPFFYNTSKALFAHTDIKLDDLLQGLSAEVGYRFTWDSYSLCTATAQIGGPFNGANAANPPFSPFSSFNLTPSQCANQTSPSVAPFVVADPSGSTSSGNSSSPSYVFGLNWKANDNAFIYVTTRHSYRAGQLNGPNFDPAAPISALQQVAPERTTDYEFGAKTNWNIDTWRFLLDVDVFRAVTNNVQEGVEQVSTGQYDALVGGPFNTFAAQQLAGFPVNPAAGSGGVWFPCAGPNGLGGSVFGGANCNAAQDPSQTIVTFNAGTRTTKGLEFQFTVQPTDDLSLNAGGNFETFHQILSAAQIPTAVRPFWCAQFQVFPCTGSINLASSIQEPKNSFNGGVRYAISAIPSEIGEVVFNAQYYWSDQVHYPFLLQPSYSLTNFRLDWNNMFGHPFDLSFFVTNAFDEHYAVSSATLGALSAIITNPAFAASFAGNPGMQAIETRGVASEIPGQPRFFGVQLRFNFGG